MMHGKQRTRCYSTSTLWQLKMGLTQKEIEKNKVVWLVESMVRVALPCSWHAFPHSPTYCTTNWHFDPFASRLLLSDLIIGTPKTWEWKDEFAVSKGWLCFSEKTHTKQDFLMLLNPVFTPNFITHLSAKAGKYAQLKGKRWFVTLRKSLNLNLGTQLTING